MLKIKDNIDLEILEKYGYIKKDDYYIDKMFNISLAQVIGTYRINIKDRTIELIFLDNETFNRLDEEWFAPKLPNNLYDLIKNDLVEKI